jgi:transposase
MKPIFARGNQQTVRRLLVRRRQALHEKATRVAQRLHGIILSLERRTTTEIARVLKVHRSSVPLWIGSWNHYGEEGLWEGQRTGRPCRLDSHDREHLCDILDSGPLAYGLETGIWTSPLVCQIIQEEFRLDYHPGHVRKLLKQLGYSVQRPTTRLVQADLSQKRKWVRYTYPNLKKTPKVKGRLLSMKTKPLSGKHLPSMQCGLGAAASLRFPHGGSATPRKSLGP